MSISELSGYDYINMNDFNINKETNYTTMDVHTALVPQDDVNNVNNDNIVSLAIKSEKDDSEVLCMRCGKPLKDIKSRLLGMGPTCYRQYQQDRNRQINLFCLKGIGKTQENGDK